MEELISCRIISPIKFSDMIVTPCPSFELPRAIAESEAKDGRVEILDAYAEAFTPTEPQGGVVEIEQQNSMAATAAPKSDRKTKAR